MLHVVFAGGFQVQQHRHLAADAVKGLQIHFESQAPGDRCQMHQAIGRAADRQQHGDGVLEGGGREHFVNGQAVPGHLHRLGTGELADAHAFRGDRRRRRPSGHRHAQRLRDARHGAGRSHDRAGSHAGHQLVVDRRDLLSADFLRAKAAPVAAAIGAGAHRLAPVRSGQHGAGDQLDRGDAR